MEAPSRLQEKMAEADKSAKKKDVPLGMLKADGSSKRYYTRKSQAPVIRRMPGTATVAKCMQRVCTLRAPCYEHSNRSIWTQIIHYTDFIKKQG